MYVRAELFSSLSPRFSFWPGNETLQFMAHSEHDDTGRLHGVFRWKDDPTMVVSPLKLRILWTQYSEVPLEQVVLQKEVWSWKPQDGT